MTASVSSVGERRGRTWRRLGAVRSDPAASYGLLVTVQVLLLLPLAPIHAVERGDLRQIYATVIAMAAGLTALLLIEEQLSARPNLRLAGLAGTFVFLMVAVTAWAIWAPPSAASGSPWGALRLSWSLGMAVGVGTSLATPDGPWERLGRSRPWRSLSLLLLTAASALALGLVVTLPLVLLATRSAAVSPAPFPGLAAPVGWSVLSASALLVLLTLRRWRRLGPVEQWVAVAALAATLGVLLSLAGGAPSTVGLHLSWAATAAGSLAVLVVLLSRMRVGDRQRLLHELAERRLLREVSTGYRADEPLAETAARLCAELATLHGAAMTTLVSLAHPLGAVPMASYLQDAHRQFDYQVGLDQPLPPSRRTYLRMRAAGGPWVDRCDIALAGAADRAETEYLRRLQLSGLQALAYAPVRSSDELVGVLVVGAKAPSAAAAARQLTENLPALADFALAAGARLAPLLRGPDQSLTEAKVLAEILGQRGYYSVFQPIVELRGGRVLGYEALTRFVNGMSPDHVFASALRCGQLDRLELLTLRHALRDAGHLLRGDQFLAVNVSPSCLLNNHASFVHALGHWQHPTVIEITEHAVISNYPSVRGAIERLGSDVRVSVDDAGAGYASLRHILELRPQFVKLDISLVQGLPHDPSREAMIAGIQHFANRSGCTLIAEGIETEEERSRLLEVGVTLGQGYLMGRPKPLLELWPDDGGTQLRPGYAKVQSA